MKLQMGDILHSIGQLNGIYFIYIYTQINNLTNQAVLYHPT